jgi:hypothetical protein
VLPAFEQALRPLSSVAPQLRAPVLALGLAFVDAELRAPLLRLLEPLLDELVDTLGLGLRELLVTLAPLFAPLIDLPPFIVVAVLAPLLVDQQPTVEASVTVGPAPTSPIDLMSLPHLTPSAPPPVWVAPSASVPASPPPGVPAPTPFSPAPPATASLGTSAHGERAPVDAVLLRNVALAALAFLGFVRLRRFVPQSAVRVLIAAPG